MDCIVIGYNETPFDEYEGMLRIYGTGSGAYRDLKYSFVDLLGSKLTYIDLLNEVFQSKQGTAKDPIQDSLKSCDIPNLAAAYLTYYLRKRDHTCEYINLFQHEKVALANYLKQGVHCIAITTTFYVVNSPLYEMVKYIRQNSPSTKIIVGGPLISNHERNGSSEQLEVALEDIGADYYVIESQGELTLSQLVECIKTDGDVTKIPNLAYFEDGTLRKTEKIAENNNLDESAIDWLQLFTGEQQGGVTLQTRTARSCAFKCAFCNYPTRAGKLTLAGLDTIEQEMDSIKSLDSVQNVVFIDDTFNVPLPRFKKICRLLSEKEYDYNWFSYFRCSNSDEEAIELMAKSGCKGVFLGIESFSPTILTNMNKVATVEKYLHSIELLHEYGILTFVSLITGFPGETEETVSDTISALQSVKPDFYRSQMWYNEPGTPIHQRRDEFDITGNGFTWSHKTMNSTEAMNNIDRMFLEVDSSTWLPQWSFDFWIIPYLLGRGISISQFKELMRSAHELLTMDMSGIDNEKKYALQPAILSKMIEVAKDIDLDSSSTGKFQASGETTGLVR